MSNMLNAVQCAFRSNKNLRLSDLETKNPKKWNHKEESAKFDQKEMNKTKPDIGHKKEEGTHKN